MIFAAIFLLLVGGLMLGKPELIWNLTERWKSRDATEPTPIYLWSIRFGGLFCAASGLVSILFELF